MTLDTLTDLAALTVHWLAVALIVAQAAAYPVIAVIVVRDWLTHKRDPAVERDWQAARDLANSERL